MKAPLEMSLKKGYTVCLLGMVLCLQPLFAQEQIGMYNASLIDTSLSILYSGLENEIVTFGWNGPEEIELVLSSKGWIGSANNVPGRFLVTPGSMLANSDTLRLLVQGKPVLERVFTVQRIPNAVVRFGNLTDTIASVEEILAESNLRMVFPDCEWIGCEARVVGYELAFQVQSRKAFRRMRAHAGKDVRLRCEKSVDGGFLVEIKDAFDSVFVVNLFTGESQVIPQRGWGMWGHGVDGASLTSNYLGIIREMKSGDRLLFRSVKYIPLGGCPRNAGLFTLTIR